MRRMLPQVEGSPVLRERRYAAERLEDGRVNENRRSETLSGRPPATRPKEVKHERAADVEELNVHSVELLLIEIPVVDARADLDT